jgi:uncharacterized membrane protein YqaE (UPF0057 family)
LKKSRKPHLRAFGPETPEKRPGKGGLKKPEPAMDIRRWILAFILPPAAVMNKEAGTIMLTGILTLLGWIPGVTAALIMLVQEKRQVPA